MVQAVTANGNGHRKRGRGVRTLIPVVCSGCRKPAPHGTVLEGGERWWCAACPVRGLADGSHQGNERHPTMAAFSAAVDSVDSLHRKLDRATLLLRQLERVLTRTGGYMSPEDQDALRSARAFLVDRAK